MIDLINSQKVLQNDNEARIKLQEAETKELEGGACVMDRKTMARLIGKLVSAKECKEVVIKVPLVRCSFV